MNDNIETKTEPEQSEHFRTTQRNKKLLEQQQQDQQPEQPEQLQPQEQPQPSPGSGITDILKSASEMLSNPILRNAIIKNPEVIRDLISENAGEELEPIVYSYLQSNFPDVYAAVSKAEDKVDKPDAKSGMIPQEQFKADIIDLDSQGYNLSQIATILTDEYDKTIFAMQVSRVLKKAEQEKEEEAKQKEQELKQPKADIASAIAQAAQKIPVRPAPIPAPAFKIDVMTSMYSNIVSALRWSAVAILTGVIGYILGRVH